MDPSMDAAHRGLTALAGAGQGAVQARGNVAAEDPGSVHRVAAAGVSDSGSALPYAPQIQKAFGSHDVSQVRAHVGGEARAASDQIGATAYATGDHIAFASQPDLHTAAHEAAHVVQQRAGVQLSGGVGRAGDAYEQHADAVADTVVRGESAEALLAPPSASTGVGSAVQREAAVQMDQPQSQAQSQPPAQAQSQPQGGNPDEAVPIIQYIVGEMTRNAASEDVSRMYDLNTFSVEQCIAEIQQMPWWQQLFQDTGQCVSNEMTFRLAAMSIWAVNVRQNGVWDHKPMIRSRFGGVWHQLGPTHQYFYDIWSNIHYGYVGAASGFSESALLDGAGAEQIGSTLLRGSMPQASPGVSGLRRFDDPSDRLSIQIGITLFRSGGASVDAVRAAVLGASGLTNRPVPPQRAQQPQQPPAAGRAG